MALDAENSIPIIFEDPKKIPIPNINKKHKM
jgi:hypothetical protein